MTVVADIGCPECGLTGPVYKLSIGRYRCSECDREFTLEEADPV